MWLNMKKELQWPLASGWKHSWPIKTIILQGHTEWTDYITCSKLSYLKHLVNPIAINETKWRTHAMKYLTKMNWKEKRK